MTPGRGGYQPPAEPHGAVLLTRCRSSGRACNTRPCKIAVDNLEDCYKELENRAGSIFERKWRRYDEISFGAGKPNLRRTEAEKAFEMKAASSAGNPCGDRCRRASAPRRHGAEHPGGLPGNAGGSPHSHQCADRQRHTASRQLLHGHHPGRRRYPERRV